MPRWLNAAIVAVGAAAIALPAYLVATAPEIRPAMGRTKPMRVVPKVILPPVEPLRLRTLAPQTAVAVNASIPFSTAPNPAARPFRFRGEADDLARAVDCLAAAMLYEAGDDPEGQRPVAQVVLNRVRHPAFPKSICGVVFQGSDRRTGCQFTFTCDGALARAYAPAQWARARDLARAAINGQVYRPVGHATHYHTNWVVPYWSASLDKIVEVRTHLFFRWTGWWGTPPAFRLSPTGTEARIAELAPYSTAHGGDDARDPEILLAGTPPGSPGDATVATQPVPVADFDTFMIALDPKLKPVQFPSYARRICGERASCKLLAWKDPALARQAIAATGDLSPQLLMAMSFSYLWDRERGFVRILWNCRDYPRDNPRDCMRRTGGATSLPAKTAPARDPGAPAALEGVRRRGDAPPQGTLQPVRPVPSVTSPAAAPSPAAVPDAPAPEDR